MKKIHLFLLTLLILSVNLYSQSTQPPKESVCIECHKDIDEQNLSQPVKDFLKMENNTYIDIHRKRGFGCNDCHGGNPTNEDKAHDKEAGFIGKPKKKDIPGLCAKCHSDIEFIRQFNPKLNTDQYQQYLTSQHGKKLQEGDQKVATCSDCHGAHTIRKTKDPFAEVFPTNIPKTCNKCHGNKEYMKEYKIPTDQYEKYKESKHGKLLLEQKDITAPACNTCHGNHGAVPPGVQSVHHICGQCHVQQDEAFQKSSHAKYFSERKAEGCATCHNHHKIPTPSDEMMNPTPDSPCMKCHQIGDRCYIATEKIKNSIVSLHNKLKETESFLANVEKLGMDVAKAKFNLHSVADSLLKARIRVHEFKVEAVEEEINEGLKVVNSSFKKGEEALKEWQIRRIGLAISVVLIIITVIALILKIKAIEKQQS
jgi:hypothetical protein